MVAEWISSSTPGANEGDTEQMAVVFIDDHPRPARVAVGIQVCADHLLAGVDIDDADAVPRTFGLVGGQADQAGRGGAEEHLRYRVVVGGNRVGAHGLASMGCPAARAAIAAPAMRAWYLPWWVSKAW